MAHPSLIKRNAGERRRYKKNKLWLESRHCWVCNKEIRNISDATIEHIIPKSRGGSNKYENLSLSHKLCNNERGNDMSLRYLL